MKTQKIIKIASILLHGEKNITPEQIEESIDIAVNLIGSEGMDREEVRAELVRRFSYFLAA